MVVIVVGAGIAFSLEPWRRYKEQEQKKEAKIAEMQRAEEQAEELVREKARAESALGKEELARRNGFTRRGEQPID
jgi:hypothetical protein